jgi:hypothetical protein
MYRWFGYLLLLIYSTQSLAFNCYLTMVKDTCWTDYNVTVTVTDASKGTEMLQIVVPKGESWSRKNFNCEKGQTLALSATFDPVFWSTDTGKRFLAQRYWQLPDHTESGISGWNVTVCFPKWFANVPTPPQATANCKCNSDNLPPLPPVKITD